MVSFCTNFSGVCIHYSGANDYFRSCLLGQQHGAGGFDGGERRTADQHVRHCGQLWWLHAPYIGSLHASAVPRHLRLVCDHDHAYNHNYNHYEYNDHRDHGHNDHR